VAVAFYPIPLSHSVRIRAFAKINLGLKVAGPRTAGYHELRTVYQTITLADRLEVSLARQPVAIRIECDNPQIPRTPANLVYQAAVAWKRACRYRGGIHIRLAKRIPVGAGLGGGSSDAAATLLALERLTGDRLDGSARLQLAAGLGSDVPLFILGGRVLGCGRGEEVYPLSDLPPRICLVVFPGFSISTSQAFRQLGSRLTPLKNRLKIDGFGARPLFPMMEWGPAENDFEQIVFAKWPELASLKRRFIQAGAETALLTGSGSALYAVFDSAEQLLRARRHIPPGWKVFRARTLSRDGYWRRLFGP
jgi:4-diphosphocytidyl-2-C-methyl-D-erythritol kinase